MRLKKIRFKKKIEIEKSKLLESVEESVTIHSVISKSIMIMYVQCKLYMRIEVIVIQSKKRKILLVFDSVD